MLLIANYLNGFIDLALIALLGYLMGSIPTSVWVAKYAYGIVIRDHGSGNAGATNVFRTLGWRPALFVFIVDVAKAVIPTLLFSRLRITDLEIAPVYPQLLAGTAAMLGHVWPLYAGFRGGKGVATATGMFLVLDAFAVLICAAVFLAVAASTRYVSLSSMSAAVTMPLALLISERAFGREVATPVLASSVLFALFILYTHRTNIQRLRRGTELRIGRSG